MITLYKIFEAKQVGILYHWTMNLNSLQLILKYDEMWSFYSYISFSRNKNLNFNKRPIKIIFDGDKMSNKFQFESYLHNSDWIFKEESEERIKCKIYDKHVKGGIKGKGIKGIKKYIIGIEINKTLMIRNWGTYGCEYDTKEEYINKLPEEIEEIQNLLPNIKISLI